MIYDINGKLSEKRADMSRELKAQINELDEEIDRIQQQRKEVDSAQQTLEQIEALLLRMSMLAREVAAKGTDRPAAVEEFEECKLKLDALSDKAELYGFNLLKDRAEVVRSVIDALIQNLPI